MSLNKKEIHIPEGIYYLGNYPQLIQQLPQGKYILNKKITGCGATTLFLDDNIPTILCSPRLELIHCKATSDRFLGKVHAFGEGISSSRKDSVLQKINQMKAYLQSFADYPLGYAPKILVTYDSTKHVMQGLHEMGLLNSFRFVVDEFQTVFTDASFRGDTEIEFMENLQNIDNVIYLSATPYLEEYLAQLPEFNTIPYIELVWPDSSLHDTNITHKPYYAGSPAKTIDMIIQGYKNNGYFEEIMDGNGVIHRSTEAVFFINQVRFIIKTIQRNGLQPHEVNIICSTADKNEEKLRKAGLTIGHALKAGQKNPPFTFATKCSYEGTDFYSKCAYTYIFSNINLDCLAVDISLDLVQIMGRQRDPQNIFRYSATFFSKELINFSEEEHNRYLDKVKVKADDTNDAITDFCQCQDSAKRSRLARKYRNSQLVERYQNDYISVVDDKITNEPKVVFNKYVMMNELRSWEIQKTQYQDGLRVLGAVNTAFGSSVNHDLVNAFMADFKGTFEERMYKYASFLDAHPECKEDIQKGVSIPSSYKIYYNTLGSDNLGALGWREANIKKALSGRPEYLAEAVRTAFPIGSWFSFKDLKATLQNVYDECVPGRIAKAKDIVNFVKVKESKRTVDSKRTNGYEVIR